MSKPVAAWLNISKDNGPVMILVDFNFGDESNWRGIFVVVKGFLAAIWSHGTSTGGRISSASGVCDSWGTATGVITFSLFCEDVSFDNMGSKEFSVGTFSFKEGTSLIKFPTVEDVREALLLYHIKIIPMVITQMPTVINNAKMSFGDNENG